MQIFELYVAPSELVDMSDSLGARFQQDVLRAFIRNRVNRVNLDITFVFDMYDGLSAEFEADVITVRFQLPLPAWAWQRRKTMIQEIHDALYAVI